MKSFNNNTPRRHNVHSPVRKITSLFLAIALCFNFYGCTFNPNAVNDTVNGVASQNQKDNAQFSDFTSRLFKESVTNDAVTLHSTLQNPENYGITDYDLTLGSYNTQNSDSTKDITDSLNELKAFDRNTLSQKQQITYDELLQYLNTELEYCDLYMFNTDVTQTIGIQVQLPIILSEYTFNEEKDVKDYISIVSDTDRFMQNLSDYEKLRSQNGYFMEDFLADKIIRQCTDFVTTANEGCLISSFNERIDALNGISEEAKSEYKTQNQTAVSEHVVKGYNILIDTLKSLKGTNKYKGGLSNYPNGSKYFEYILKHSLGWSKSVDEFDSLLDTYMMSDLGSAQRIIRKNPDIINNIDSFKSDITDPDAILKDLKKHITDDYPESPELNWTLKTVPDSLQSYASPAMYFTPQIDNLSVNSIYINPGSSDTSDIYTTLAHEGYPGHMYQITYFASSDPDPVRYLIEPGGYVEGWATYAEMNSYSYIKSQDPDINTISALNHRLTLYLYAKVDIGVNYHGWNSDDVYSFISSYGIDNKDAASEMYAAMVSEPGNYCKYVLGYLGFMELEKNASSKAGDNFNKKEFNKYILDYGPVQFDILFNNLDKWADEIYH